MSKLTKSQLEQDLITNLKELTNLEQNEIKVQSALFMNYCTNLKKAKLEALEENITNQILFYGKKVEKYRKQINLILTDYENMIDQIQNLYTSRLIAIIQKLQGLYDNQKISITNCKIAIDCKDVVKLAASEYKVDNYETLIRECKNQILECINNMEIDISQIFYNQNTAISIKKANLFQKIINLFLGKNKVGNFVLNPLNLEIEQIGSNLPNETTRIEADTLNNIAVLEDGILQTKTIFKDMLEEYGYGG